MNWNLIHKFLSGNCTKSEKEMIEVWRREDLQNEKFLRGIQKIWRVDPREDHVNIEKAWDRFREDRMIKSGIEAKSAVYANEINNREAAISKLSWYQKSSFYAAAASILLLVTVFLVVRIKMKNDSHITFQQIVTKKGEKTSLKLNDGTRVKINAESILKIPSDYGKENRTLYLQGEAFFKVEHDVSKPFRVYSGDIYTEDIGTQFNFQAFPDDSTIAIVVTEGKIALHTQKSHAKKSVYLSPNERAIILKGDEPDIQRVKKLSSYVGWTKGELVFDDTPFQEVAKKLERWYGVKCIFEEDKILNHKLTATFKNEPLSNTLKLISRSMNIQADIKGQTVKFSVQQ